MHRKIAVVGSRVGINADLVWRECIKRFALGDTLITGGAAGVDTYAEQFAKEYGFDIMIFVPRGRDSPKYYLDRNRLIVEAADEVLAFWNGHSRGTLYTMNYAKELGKKVEVFTRG